jgi:methanogenic corrinoid protein MtbC1
MGGQLDDLTVRCLQHLLHDSDAYGLESTLIAARGNLGNWWQVADVLGKALTELGRRWEDGACSVAQEHEASRRLQDALGACGNILPSPPSEPRCVLAAVEGELHTLGLSMAELCVHEAGWASVWLGAPTPTSVLVEAIERLSPSMVCVSASACSSDAKILSRHCRSIARACRHCSSALVLGGEGAWHQKPPYGHRVRSFAEFVPLLR